MSVASIAIVLAFTFIVAIIIDIAIAYAQRKQNPPLVRTYLPWIGSGVAFYRTRIPFFNDCRLHYGSYYRFSLRPTKSMVVVSSRQMLKRFLADKRLDNKDIQYRTLSALGSRLNQDQLAIPIHKHFVPSMGRTLSSRTIVNEWLSPLCHEFRAGLEHLPEKNTLLSDVIGKVLYEAINAVLFGPSFPSDTYADFLTLDHGMLALLSGVRLTALPSIFARNRLLRKMVTYVRENHSRDGKARVSVLSAALESVEHTLPVHEQAVCMLSLLWVLQTNIKRSIFWLTAYILADAEAHRRLRAEVDETVARLCPGHATLLYNDPDSISENFPLATSAVTESLRLSTLPSSLRIASADIQFQTDDESIFTVRRGEMMMGDIRPIHHDDEVYPEALTFKADRFLSSSVPPPPKILSWGSGIHICKGRFFVQYIMKLWIIMLLETYDCASPITSVPDMDPSSWSSIADPINDVPVFLCPRGESMGK
ncbi:cytochrome P450 [Armillaria solidipes]|uniref:Cytochrome P450 n=1 Tax=Armillaria solidipes TaxID=1076256 RepID=A0A2H3AQ02_9AGAR|nr:cytochrome P450 [Armillaria solidipes]